MKPAVLQEKSMLFTRRGWMLTRLLLAAVCFLGLHGTRVMGQAPEDEPAASYPNWRTPTFGGKQLWTDHVWRGGWRIQQHALTGHWRLLNENNIRYAWGSREACDLVLEREQPHVHLPHSRVVILSHGLMRTAASMRKLEAYLAEQNKWSIVRFEYASTRASITDHAAALREVVRGLPSDVHLSFVGHSMGNIVARHAIGDWQRMQDQQTLDRIESVVMLGPPNQGSSIARQLSRTGVFGWVTGTGGLELGPNWEEFEAKLAIPHCPFGIIAGHLPEGPLRNPLVDGEGDFIVSVEETKLPGATDFLEVPRLHSTIMDYPEVHQAVANFLVNHRFE